MSIVDKIARQNPMIERTISFFPRHLPKNLLISPIPYSIHTCLLYTSDAADERSSVDLGGRRIIKKKKT